jgi:murein DD-endopeptidase MepM/ murein hydrolase activator NlpD
MPLLSLSASVKVTRLNPFAGNEDHNFEGDSTLTIDLAAASGVAGPARIAEALEWWCADGGWVGDLQFPDVASPWGLNADVNGLETNTLSRDAYDPYECAIFMVRAVDAAGVQPDEWIVAQAPVAIDAATDFTDTVETRPEVLSPPPPPLPIDIGERVFIAVRGPVEAYDLVSPSGTGLVRQRTLVIAGQIVNWFNDSAVLDALVNPGSVTGPVDLRITVDDYTAGAAVVSGSWFDQTRRSWHRDLGRGEEKGFTMQAFDRVAAFMVHVPVPETFSFGMLTLEFIWPAGGVKRSIPVETPAVDVLHWPVVMGEGEGLFFTNGPSPRFNGHTVDLHQHHAYDITVGDRPGGTLGAPLCAVANGTVRRTHDAEMDAAVGTGSTGVANRVFMEHPHVDGNRYSVFAHIQQHSAIAAGSFVGAGTGVAAIGNNGSTSGEHLHLAYYRLNRFGRMRMLPMAFAMRRPATSETVVGVPADGVYALPATMGGAGDATVDTLDVFVTTGNRNLAGTDDDVSLTIGGRTFNLSNVRIEPFERGKTDQFSITPWPGLRLSDLRGGIKVHKSPDGRFGGWNFDGIKIVANGITMLDAQGLDTWLSSEPWVNNLEWRGTIA